MSHTNAMPKSQHMYGPVPFLFCALSISEKNVGYNEVMDDNNFGFGGG